MEHTALASLLGLILLFFSFPVTLRTFRRLNKLRIARLRRQQTNWVQPPRWFLESVQKATHLVLPVSVHHHNRSPPPAHGRILYVANHQVAALEAPTLLATVYAETGRLPRGVMDRVHLGIPLWSEFLVFMGAVFGDRDSVAEMM
ncbi:hypothetical protein HKX48_001873, partial [Thoreauomyces humboldtii]